jgi:phosphoglycerate dehydrogenase-like enzyme
MPSWKVVVTARAMDEVGQSALALLREAGCEIVDPQQVGPMSGDALLRVLDGADAVLAGVDRFTAEAIGSPEAAQLKLISRWGVGFDAIDVAAATGAGIVVAYTPGLLNETVADFAFALLLALARHVHLGHGDMTNGTWRAVWGVEVFGKTLGLVGCGRIGQAMARRASGFDLRVLAYDVAPDPAAEKLGVTFVGLDELLAESDFVSIHAALTPGSRGLIGEAQLHAMKPTALLVNTARGALIDEDALAKALHDRQIAGAALDAFVAEPLPADSPLRSAPNVLLTPHFASYARETGERVSHTAVQAIVDLKNGRKPQLVLNPEVFASPALRAAMAPPVPGSE